MKTLFPFVFAYYMGVVFASKFASLPIAQSRIREGVVIAAGAICDNKVPAYYVIEGRGLVSQNYVVYNGIKEADCVSMCSDNRDSKGNSLLCASFTYNSLKKKCFVYREVAAPNGVSKFTQFEKGQRYYEKFCLPGRAGLKCGEKPFFRAHQQLLVGFAKNVSLEPNLETCVSKCVIMGSECKSSMYFYDEGECIVNSESALTQGEFFVEEEIDKVVYVENGCLLGNQRRSQKGAVISIVEVVAETDQDALIDALLMAEGQGDISEEQQTTTTIQPTTAQTTTRKTTTQRRTTTRQPKKVTAPQVQLKLRQQQQEEFIKVESTGVLSEWSQWSLCDIINGRRVRRRQCSDGSLRCSGSKFQSQWCSDLDSGEQQTAPPSTFAPPVTRPHPVVRPLVNLMPDLTGRDLLPNSAWGPWSSECLSFAFEQPCENNRQRLGYQNRQCNGFPFQCVGPFFRYCFIPC